MLDLKLPTHRRGFLGSVAVGAATLGLSSLVRPLALAGEAETVQGPTKEDPALTAWLNRIKGKHRQVYDMPEVNGGFGLAWSRIFYMTNNETGVPDGDITVVAVLRHNALPVAFADGAWEKYKLGEVFQITDPKTKTPSVRNIFAHVQPDELPLPKMSVDELLASGVLFGACNMAIKFYSGIVSRAQNVPVDQVRQDWTAAVLPGIQIVPSGVWAVNRAQERGCSYCFAG